MQIELGLREIGAYAKDAIADLDESIPNVIRDMNPSDLYGDFVS